MGAKRHPISKVDTAWLRMEQPANLMMITGVIFFDHAIDFEDLLGVINKRFLAFPRFLHKAVVGSRQCFWEEDEDFDILSHVRRTALPGKADLFELQELVSELASTPLDHSKPLWQFHVVENYEGGPVLIARIHHCYADGIALIQVLLSLTDTDPEGHQRPRSHERWQERKAAESNIFRRLLEPAKDGIDAISHWTGKLMEESFNLLKEPKMAADYAHLAGEMADELAGAMLLPDDPDTRFKGRLGARKRVAWAQPLDLTEVKGLSRVLGCTVNDVLIATITGALRQYLTDRGDDVDELQIRATVPVNLRPLEHAKELGNHFGLVFLPLPIGEENPLARLQAVHQFMDELKSSKQAAVAFGLLAALGMGPARLQKPMLDMMSRKATTVLTNVPGPRQSLYLAGSEVSEMMFWVPQSGSIGMGISILSYNGKVFCGLMTDRRLVPEPSEIVDNFGPEFEKLLYLTLMLDEDTIADDDAMDGALTNIIDFNCSGAQSKPEATQHSAEVVVDLNDDIDSIQDVLSQITEPGQIVEPGTESGDLSDKPDVVEDKASASRPAVKKKAASRKLSQSKPVHSEQDSVQQKIAKKKAAQKRMNLKKKTTKVASNPKPQQEQRPGVTGQEKRPSASVAKKRTKRAGKKVRA